MARTTPPFPISGTVGGFTFAQYKDKTVLRKKQGPPRKYTGKRRTKGLRQSENRQTFGGASKAACYLYSTISLGQRQLFKPYSHNLIATKLRDNAERTQRAVTQYTFRAAHAALHGLDLSHDESPSAQVKITPIGPHHAPDSIRIHGLDEAAKSIPVHGNAHLQVRLQLRYVEFSEVERKPNSKKWAHAKRDKFTDVSPRSGWIPTEILPKEGLLLSLTPTNTDRPVLVFVTVEWREVREVGSRIITKHKYAVVKLVAMRYSEALAHEIANLPQKQPKPSEYPVDLRSAALQDPNAYLSNALAGLMGTGLPYAQSSMTTQTPDAAAG